MLKNSKSVTLFCYFSKKITPAFTGAIVKGNHNYNKQAGCFKKGMYVFLFLLVPAYI